MWSEKFWIIFHHLGANSWYPRMSIGLTPLLQLHHLCGIFLDHPFQGISNVLLTSGVVVKFLCLQAFKSLFKQLHHCQKKVKGGRCLTTNYIVSPGLVKKLHETLTLNFLSNLHEKIHRGTFIKGHRDYTPSATSKKTTFERSRTTKTTLHIPGQLMVETGALVDRFPQKKKDLWKKWTCTTHVWILESSLPQWIRRMLGNPTRDQEVLAENGY